MNTATHDRLSVSSTEPAQTLYRGRTQQTLALAMLALESLAIGFLSGTWVFLVLCIVAAFVAVFSRIRFQMDRQRIYDVMALTAVGFFIKHLLSPDNPRYMDLFTSQPIALAVAEYALAMQVLQFYVQRRDDRLPFMFPGTGVIALTCAAIVDVNKSQREIFLLMCVAFAVLAALYCDASRRFLIAGKRRSFGRPTASTIVLLIIGGLAWTSATALYRYERDLDELVRRWLMHEISSQRTGLSESSRLGSVNLQKQQASLEITLRVRSKSRPEYFRARAYDVFDGTQWLPVTRGQTVGARALPDNQPAARHGGNAFRLRDWPSGNDSSLNQYEVWPGSSLSGSFPSPLNPVWLQVQSDLVTVDSHFVLRSDDTLAGLPYTVDVSASPIVTDPWLTVSDFLPMLATPPRQINDFPEIRKLAEELFADCETTQEKVDAAVGYFLSNYSYSLRVDVPEKWDDAPIVWFLLEQPDAHCEFFASGAAVLLRLGGVPCRYVTGFVVHEENRFSHEWVARNRDAHAWVEAWDEERGWVTVEATASGGVPEDQAVSASAQFREFLATRFQQLRIEWQRKGFRGLLLAVLRRLLTPIGVTVLALLCAIGLYVWRNRIGSLIPRRPKRPDPRLQAFQQILHRVDRVMEKLSLPRAPQQTLESFAAKLALTASETSASARDDQLTAATQQRVAGAEERGTSDEPPDRIATSGSPLRSTPATPMFASQESGDPSSVSSPLQEAADWYRRYARLRYGRGDTDDSLDDLAIAADLLMRKLRRQ